MRYYDNVKNCILRCKKQEFFPTKIYKLWLEKLEFCLKIRLFFMNVRKLSFSAINGLIFFSYTHFFISTWTFWHEPSLSTFCAYFLRPKPSCAMCLIFLKLKPSCAYSAKVITLKKAFFGQIVLVMCLFFFVGGFMCYVLNFFKKWAFMCLWGHVLIKKMSVEKFKF